jgi:hypothetical protein
MVTSYPDVSCWAWAMAHAALITPMWLNACGKSPIISPLAGSTITGHTLREWRLRLIPAPA